MIQLWIWAPGTHYSWVYEGSCEIQSLPDTSTQDQKLNLRPSDLESKLMPYPLGHVLKFKCLECPQIYIHYKELGQANDVQVHFQGQKKELHM